MGRLILLRHGQSEWNKKNLFTGWVDIPLSSEGIEEAIHAGHKVSHIPFDVIFISELVRAQMTAFLAMSVHKGGKLPRLLHKPGKEHLLWDEIHSPHTLAQSIPTIGAWQLNERMYGVLQGLDKDETRQRFGAEQVQIWRRSYDVAPPEGESLEMTTKRTIPYFEEAIIPHLREGKNILVVAHGNSLRAIVMHIDGLSKEEVVKLEIPTGEPFAYLYENGSFCRGSLDG